jgi:prevent-host-death family protein
MTNETPAGVHRVGVKELRGNLAHWLDVAASGEDVIVTERGRSKVRITDASPQAILEQLAREGKVRLATKPWQPLGPPIPVKGSPVTDEIMRGHGH